MQQLANQHNFVSFVLSKKFDIALVLLIASLAVYYHLSVTRIVFPIWDGALYLENAKNWFRNEPLEASYRPPLLSWIIAGVWSVTGEDWTIAKYIQPIFTLGAGVILYQTLKKQKGNLFAFGVAALTMLNGYVIYWSTQILTEGLSLFFLVLSVYFLKSERQYNWIFAGIAIGLTFGSRYPIFILAITLFIIESIVRPGVRKKFFGHALVGMVPVMLLIIMAIYLKSESFAVAIQRDTQLSILLSPFYFENFIRIFGFISILLPIVFLFRRTFIDKYNYMYIGWLAAGFLFWSAISENQQERFMIQIMPAVYFLTILAIQNIWKGSAVLSVGDLREFGKLLLTRGYWLFKQAYSTAVRWFSFFPLRYYLCGFVIAYLSLSYLPYLIDAEEEALHRIFQFFGIKSFFVYGQLHANFLDSTATIVPPIYAQLIFMIFFPTIAIAARINAKKRVGFLSFGILCFSAFVVIEFMTVFIPLPSPIVQLISILVTVVVGGLIIELSLWSALSIPPSTRIKRILRRGYSKEYLLLLVVLVGSILFTTYVFMFLRIALNSPLMIYALLTLSSVTSVSYLLANLIYEINRQTKRSRNFKEKYHSKADHQFSISFLIPAYNEEEFIGKCIESIDNAAGYYKGKTEIVIVNDGSKDNTERIVLQALTELKYAHGKIFSISNSGKGFALDYGLNRTSGEIIFRMDADSWIDKKALNPLIEHFEDPIVGSVSGLVFPLEAKTVLGKAQSILFASYLYVKRAEEVFDSIIVQPGPSTAFRKDALLKIGGWTHNQFGEDGEISSRIARFGYKSEFEQSSVVYSDLPQTLKGFVAQRSRWSIAFYHSRGRNLEQIKELSSPRALVFLHNLESHGAGFGLNFAWVLLAAALVTGNTGFFLADLTPPQVFLATAFIKLTAIHAVITASTGIIVFVCFEKIKKIR